MTAALALFALIDAGAAERLHPRDLEGAAVLLARACDDAGPVLPPYGVACVRIGAVLWALETNATFAVYPRARHGCGPLQVVPLVSKRFATPPCSGLRLLAAGFDAGIQLFRLKLERASGKLLRAFEYYNGHPRYRKFYSRRALALFRKVDERGVVREWESGPQNSACATLRPGLEVVDDGPLRGSAPRAPVHVLR